MRQHMPAPPVAPASLLQGPAPHALFGCPYHCVRVRLAINSIDLITTANPTRLTKRPTSYGGSIAPAAARHRYGRASSSAPMPTIPSMINTSSPITIQPCNAVMLSSPACDITVVLDYGTPRVLWRLNSSGSFAIFTAIRRALSNCGGVNLARQIVGERITLSAVTTPF